MTSAPRQLDGSVVFIEVKGRVEGAPDFTITHNEVLTSKNLGDDYRLALVEVSEAGPQGDQLRYLMRPFDVTATDDFRITKLVLDWRKLNKEVPRYDSGSRRLLRGP